MHTLSFVAVTAAWVTAITVVPAAARAQSHALVVSVVDASDNRPIEGADVRLTNSSRAARTDWIGEARFVDLPVSRQHVQVRMVGYPIAVVLIGHFPGLTIATVESSMRDSIVATQPTGLLFSMAPTCPVAIYIDGIRSPDGLEGIRTEELHGVEYYDITAAPVQYRRLGPACKVLLFWTKP
jgi:hypothetical protein